MSAQDLRVKHLDTVNFDEIRTDYESYIRMFQDIVKEINGTIDELLGEWEGEGKKAFEKDAIQVRTNLKDISDIMYDLRNSLNKAHVNYVKYDTELSKAINS